MKKTKTIQTLCLLAVVAVAIIFTSCKKSNEKQILTFGFKEAPEVIGIIDEDSKTVAVYLPEAITSLTPEITLSKKAKVDPPSGTTLNFAEAVVLTVTAQDGTTASYTVRVAVGPIELVSPIMVNTTLKKTGLPVDYYYAGDYNNPLKVIGNATLTIEPGVTIQFTDKFIGTNGSTYGCGMLHIEEGATIKAIGEVNQRIQFIGCENVKMSWGGIVIRSSSDNQFAYCDFLNMGNTIYYSSSYTLSRSISGGMCLIDAKVGISHCKFTKGYQYGLSAWNEKTLFSQFTTFDHNVIEGYIIPVYIESKSSLSMLEKFDMTSDFTDNSTKNIEVVPFLTKDVTLNATTVPYYFTAPISAINNTLTINEGVTIYMKDNIDFNGSGTNSGRLIINGSETKPVKIEGASHNGWGSILFNGLQGSVINHCMLTDGGKERGYPTIKNGFLKIYAGADLKLSNVSITTRTGYAIEFMDCDYKLTYSGVNLSGGIGNVLDCQGKVQQTIP